MKKFFIGIPLVLLIILTWFIITLDTRIKNHTEETIAELVGAPTTIQSVDISLSKGEVILSNLIINNPHGYSDNTAIELDSIMLNLEIASILSQPLIINNLIISGTNVNLEFKENLRSNMQDILNTINGESDTSGDEVQISSANNENSEPSNDNQESALIVEQIEVSPDDSDFLMQIKNLRVDGINLTASTSIASWSDTLPGIQMENLGGDKGLSTERLGIIIVQQLAQETLERSAKRTLTKIIKEKVKDKALDVGSKLLKLLE